MTGGTVVIVPVGQLFRRALQITGLCQVALLFILPQMARAQQDEEKARKRITSYYASWVGVKAPEIGPAAVDRSTGPPVRLKSLGGKRVLLIGFDSGNLHQMPD